MSGALDPKRKDLLSSHLDHEGAETRSDAEALMHDSFSAQLHYRNLESVSRATQQAGVPIAPATDFLSRVMGALDGLEQEDPAEDFEVLSAWTDGEWELETESITPMAETVKQNIRTLGAAMAQLPVPVAPTGFAQRVMATIAQTEQPQSETLSALYDRETGFAEVRCLQEAPLAPAATTLMQNFATLSGALRRLSSPQAPAGFAADVLAALPRQETSFETLSAYHDLEANLELPESPALLQTFAGLSTAMQALPAMSAPEGFAARVMQAIETAESFDFEAVSALHDGEAAFEPNQQAQQMLQQMRALSAGFAALPAMEAPAGFADRVMASIDALPDFETLSAAHDGEAAGSFSDAQLQPLRALSRAISALPAYDAPSDFVAKVMLATEQSSKRNLFALPSLFQTRLGQVAAGFAIFGLLASATYFINSTINNPVGPTVTAAVEMEVVPVDNAPEDVLFSMPEVNTVMDDTLEVDQTTEKDYNLLIGG